MECRPGRFKKSKIGKNPTKALRPGGTKHKPGEHAHRDDYTLIYDWNDKFVMIVSGGGFEVAALTCVMLGCVDVRGEQWTQVQMRGGGWGMRHACPMHEMQC